MQTLKGDTGQYNQGRAAQEITGIFEV